MAAQTSFVIEMSIWPKFPARNFVLFGPAWPALAKSLSYKICKMVYEYYSILEYTLEK